MFCHVIDASSVMKRKPDTVADDVRPEEERCDTLTATIDPFGEAVALRRILRHDDESNRDLRTAVAGLEYRPPKTDDGR